MAPVLRPDTRSATSVRDHILVLGALFSGWYSSDPDAPLVEAARAGDERAFDALVYRYQASLVLFVEARLDSVIDAQDVAQEIFLSAWRHLSRFQGRSRFRTWLFGIAVNHCADAARRQRSRRTESGGLEALENVHATDAGGRERWQRLWGAPEPLGDFRQWAEEREDLRQHLAALSEAEREVLDLYYYGELNLPEISQILGINLNTLKYRFYQAHRRLRASLSGEAASESAASKAPTSEAAADGAQTARVDEQVGVANDPKAPKVEGPR